MERLAREANIKLMVNYWNEWVAPSHDLFRRVRAGEVGPIQKIIVQYGHSGPKEIGVSQEFAKWLYDPVRNGGGAIMDFGCYGAELSLWLKGRPERVYATTHKLKIDQGNKVDDDATIVLDYPDATAVIEASWDWPYGKNRWRCSGQKAACWRGTTRSCTARPVRVAQMSGRMGKALRSIRFLSRWAIRSPIL